MKKRLIVKKALQEQNLYNHHPEAYNCGGFALGLENWITPYYNEENKKLVQKTITQKMKNYDFMARQNIICEGVDSELDFSKIKDNLIDNDVNFLLTAYPFLEKVNLNQVSEKEKLIAYRIFVRPAPADCHYCDNDGNVYNYDTDFHFRVRINGCWFEKNGRYPVHRTYFSQKPWCYFDNCLEYDSKIVYFRDNR